jgi:sterol desaturase/sphingolipid hydroxylase (fatty acid hydroxylase superfamily)
MNAPRLDDTEASVPRARPVLVTGAVVLAALGLALLGDPHAALSALSDPMGAFMSPTRRVFLPFLLSSAAIATLVWAVALRRRCSLLAFAFPRRIWLHRSALLDYRLALMRALLQVAVLAALVVPVNTVALAVARVLWRHVGFVPASALGDTTILLLFSAAAFVADDFARYVVHRLAHRVPALWELHKVHHSAEVLTPMTVYRTHPIESVLMRGGAALALGIVAGIFLWMFPGRVQAWEVAGVYGLSFLWNLFGANLRHSHVWLSYGSMLEHVLISPAQHQLHHSNDPRHYDTNFGSALAVWDWMFGSLRVAGRRERLTFGLPKGIRNHGDSVGSVIVSPLGCALRALVGGTRPSANASARR